MVSKRRSRTARARLAAWAATAYGLACYGGFLATFGWTVAFVGDVGPLPTIDGPIRSAAGPAIAIDVGLLALFGLQHSVMARRAFKRRWQRFVPASVERSTYVLMSSLVLALLYWQWRPVGPLVIAVEGPLGRVALRSLQVCGWLLVLVSTALINHADLFGLRQVFCRLRGRRYFSPGFVSPGPYNIVRHPLYLGWLLAFWATPRLSVGHLLFAAAMTFYVVIAIRFEERDLLAEHGPRYERYRARIPMLVPFLRFRRRAGVRR
ncbi:MAG: isoprenylcysteine carboxylmethyltransferase family protein [Planctomycetes bacterium]|nr:isoprenylcysteine carboxylmethyltransferase family protein [Planctomycetota bacterium]